MRKDTRKGEWVQDKGIGALGERIREHRRGAIEAAVGQRSPGAGAEKALETRPRGPVLRSDGSSLSVSYAGRDTVRRERSADAGLGADAMRRQRQPG